MKKIGRSTYSPEKSVYIKQWASVVGKTEKQGPLGLYFDISREDEYFGKNNFEEAESEMQREAIQLVTKKSQIYEENIDCILAGDLENQCAGSNYCMRDLGVPYFGLYGACSTYAEALILASVCIDTGGFENVIAVSSSHNCAAERQYRFPLEYGALRSQTAQWTVTGAGATLLSAKAENDTLRISRFCIGRVTDFGVKDINNMGAAMAPAAADTLSGFFADSETSPEEYDLIVTGDLGKTGHDLMRKIMKEKYPDFSNTYDCGRMIYDRTEQDVHSGGSGAGCGAAVMNAYFFPKMKDKKYNKILFVGTGALMSPTRVLQKESIPAIAHLVEITSEKI